MRKITIKVTQKNIDTAVQKNSHHCMIADALQKSVPSARFIQVDTQSIRFSDSKKGRRYIYMTPPIAQKAILDFDYGDPNLKGFTFSITKGHARQMRVRSPNWVDKRLQEIRMPWATKEPIVVDNVEVKKTRRTKKTKRYMPAMHREFGLRAIKRT